MLITKKLPTTVTVGALEYPINSDFRVLIEFESLMQDNNLSDTDKIDKALKLFYPVVPIMDKTEAIEKLLLFYRCGKEDNTPGKGKHSKIIYSYEYDSDFIFDAFLSQYGVDLTETDLHWWKFKAMFAGLQDCKLVEIMGYRAMKIDAKMSKGQKDFYRKMKRLYALPDKRTEEEKEQDMIKAFNGLF